MSDRLFRNRKWIAFLGYFTLGVLLFFSVHFYLERTIYTDIAFQAFVIIQTKFFAIQNYRFGAAMTQIFPLLATLAKLPLKQLLVLYSSAFYIYYIAIFILLFHLLRNDALAVILLLFLTLLTSYSFYWAQSEYPQGMAFLILTLAVLIHYTSNKKPSIWSIVQLAALGVVTIFFHPLIIVPAFFALIYLYLDTKINLRTLFIVLAAIAVMVVLKNVAFRLGSYEGNKMGNLRNFLTLFPHYVFIPSNKFFARQLVGDYVAYLGLTIAVTVFYLKNRLYLKLLWFLGVICFYTLLINISFYNIGDKVYLQNLHLPLAFLVGLPFCFEVLPEMKPKVFVPLLFVVFIFRLGIIYSSHTYFTARVDYLKHLLTFTKQYSTNKFWIANDKLPGEKLGDPWAISYETLLLSSLHSPDSARTIETGEVIEQHQDLLHSDYVFINRLWGWDENTIPTEYFNLGRSNYEEIKGDVQDL